MSAISAIGISARRAEGVPVRDGGNDSLHRERRDIQSRGRRGKPDEGDVEPAVADVFQRTPCGRRLGDDLDPGMARSEGRDRAWKHGRDRIDDTSEQQPPDRARTRVAAQCERFRPRAGATRLPRRGTSSPRSRRVRVGRRATLGVTPDGAARCPAYVARVMRQVLPRPSLRGTPFCARLGSNDLPEPSRTGCPRTRRRLGRAPREGRRRRPSLAAAGC